MKLYEKKMKKVVIIPSAKLIPIELQAEFGPIASAMIPIEGKPVLSYIAESYGNEYDYYIGVYEAAEDVQEYCEKHVKQNNIFPVNVGNTQSLGETVLNILLELKEEPDFIVINFADTAVPDTLPEGDVFCFSNQSDAFRWTTYWLDDNLKITEIDEKQKDKNHSKKKYNVIIGVFSLTKFNKFKSLLMEKIKQTDKKIDPFYLALQDYFNALPAEKKVFYSPMIWYDFGHLDTYFETKKKIGSGCRHFNAIEVDSPRGIIRKTSQNTSKFIHEIEWYLKLPNKLKHIAPRILNYDLQYFSPSVEMEFYGYPTLTDLFLYGDLDLGAWLRILHSIDLVIRDMTSYAYVPESDESLVNAMKQMYEIKTLNRLNNILNDEKFQYFRSDSLQINQKKVLGLDQVVTMLPSKLKECGIYENPHFSIIHGDLCFSNILYDKRNGIIRTIDPRGSFGGFDIYGDPKYDMAKLSHSIMGDYDFFVADRFDLHLSENKINLEVHLKERHKKIKRMFHDWMSEKYDTDELMKIQLIESLLFLSMVPLHQDRFSSQQAFICRGLELFSKIVQEK